MYIKLKLKSDLCAATGHGRGAYINTDINYDESSGLPYVPAKRLKGCLREAGLEILDILQDEKYMNSFYELFGEKGAADSGKLKISDGLLNYKTAGVGKYDVLNVLTTLRHGTRTEGEDTALIRQAKDQSLRVIRVLKKGEEVLFKVEFPNNHADFLEKCCAMLHSLGSNRTRGLGEVDCSLEHDSYPIIINQPKEFYDEHEFETTCLDSSKELYQTSFKIHLNEPIISTPLSGGADCEGHIPGSMLLGYFAGRWIERNKNVLDKEGWQPHQNPEFRRIFLEGKVKFGFAYPGEILHYPTPASIKTNKAESIANDDCYRANSDATKKLGGYVYFCENKPKVLKPRREAFMHHARPLDRAKGHPQKSEGVANVKDGTLYGYTALSANQVFSGTIVGTKQDLEIIQKLLPETGEIRLGRSRTAQYGSAVFGWNKPSDKTSLKTDGFSIAPGRGIYVMVRSPIILHDDDGTIKPCVELLVKKLPPNLELCRVFVSETIVAGYNTKWLLPRQQMPAIQAGSVLVLSNTGEEPIKFWHEYFIGLRTGEGFGHISVEPLGEGRELQKPQVGCTFIPFSGTSSGNSLHEKVEKAKKKSEMKQLGEEKVAKALESEEAMAANAQLGRLWNVVRVAKDKKDLREKINCSERGWKDDKKKELILNFCFEKNTPPDETDWENYKIWLKAAIHHVRLSKRREGDGEQSDAS